MLGAIRKGIGLILVACTINTASVTKSNTNPDIAIISDNFTTKLVSEELAPYKASDIQDADGIISRISYDKNENCYFADIDYKDGNTVEWPAAMHLARTERLAIAYRAENDAVKKDSYKKYVLKLIDYWCDKNPENSNWWHNWLSNPNILGQIGILMKADLSAKQLNELAELVGQGSYTLNPAILIHNTGANAIDFSMATIEYGVLTGSTETIKTAISNISSELDYSCLEGIKRDGSYFQHGTRLYMGGYGIDFVKGMCNILTVLSGTSLGFSTDKLKPFSSFICDGLKGMSFGATLDPSTLGRSVSRVNAQPLEGIVPYLYKLSSIPEMPRSGEIKAFADSIVNNSKSDNGLKYYDTAKFLVINNNDFYFSFRGGDNTLMYSEKMNDENVLSYNSSYPGVTTVMRSGREYTDIAPLYDYSMIPGTTAVHENDAQLQKHIDVTYRPLIGKYGAKVSDGAAVVFAKTVHEGVSMTVSCFATDDAVLLLGAGMRDLTGKAMNTTIDQSFYAGSYSQNGNTVIHNGIKYCVLSGGKLTAKSEHRTGDWNRNNRTYPNAYAEGDIFTISLANTGSYAYSIMSVNTDAEFEVIVNNEGVQAVKLPDGRIAAAFMSRTSFKYNGTTYSGALGQAKIFG